MTSSRLSFRYLEMFIWLLSVSYLFRSLDMVLFWSSLISLTLSLFLFHLCHFIILWTLASFKSLKFLYNTKQYSTLGIAFSCLNSSSFFGFLCSILFFFSSFGTRGIQVFILLWAALPRPYVCSHVIYSFSLISILLYLRPLIFISKVPLENWAP